MPIKCQPHHKNSDVNNIIINTILQERDHIGTQELVHCQNAHKILSSLFRFSLKPKNLTNVLFSPLIETLR